MRYVGVWLVRVLEAMEVFVEMGVKLERLTVEVETVDVEMSTAWNDYCGLCATKRSCGVARQVCSGVDSVACYLVYSKADCLCVAEGTMMVKTMGRWSQH